MAFSHRGMLGGKLSGKKLELGVCIAASSGFFLLGYDQGVMGGIITEASFLELFPKMDSSYKSGSIQALVVAIYEVGCLFGAMFIVGYGDKLGRRRSILTGACIMIVGAIIQTASFGLAQLIVGRIVTGIGNGMNTGTIPVWQSEMAPPAQRGFLVLFEGALITAGIMLAYWLNYGFYFVTDYGSFQWRFPIAFQIVFGVVLIVGVILFPESPRWLVKRGKDDEALQIMADLKDTTTDDHEIKEDIQEMKDINAQESGKLTPKQLLTNGRQMNGWRFWVACGVQFLQQVSGINLVTYYSTVVFENSLGFDGAASRFITGWLGTEYFAAACVALVLVDRFGRRTLMIWGAGGMAASLAIIAGCLSTGESKGAIGATVFIFIYDTCFAIGWLGIGWLYPAEITPLRTRAQTNGFSTMTNWFFNYAVVQLAPIMINTIAWKTYFVFMCFNLAAMPIVYFLFPETNGWKLETMDAIFEDAHANKQNPVFTEKRWRKKGWKNRKDNTGTEADSHGSGSNDDQKTLAEDGTAEHLEEKSSNV